MDRTRMEGVSKVDRNRIQSMTGVLGKKIPRKAALEVEGLHDDVEAVKSGVQWSKAVEEKNEWSKILAWRAGFEGLSA